MRLFAQTKTFMELTVEQRHALRTEGFLLIKAVAGSGKTRLLVALVLKALMDNPDRRLEDLAIITFTRKAGGELRTRLKTAMEMERTNAPTEQEKEFWNRHLAELPGAKVGTIDGLVQDLLRQLALSGKRRIDPALGVLDDLGMDDLLERALDQVLDEPERKFSRHLCALQVHHDRRSMLSMVQLFIGRGDAERAKEAFERVMQSEETCRQLADAMYQPSQDQWQKQWLPLGPLVKDQLNQAVNELSGRKPRSVIVQSVIDLASTWKFEEDNLFQCFAALSKKPLFTAGKTKYASGLCSQREGPYSPALDALQDQLQPLLEDFFAIIDTTNLAELEDQEQYQAWIQLFHAVQEKFLDLCREENQYPFEILARMLDHELDNLTEEDKKACGLPFERVLVDEFQDNTSLQWRLTQKLSGGNDKPNSWNRITVVGDPEQAIYHWRGSNAQLMEIVQKQYADFGPLEQLTWYDRNHDPEDSRYRSSTAIEKKGICTLSHNWRTAKKTLAWIDQVSTLAMEEVESSHQTLRHGERLKTDSLEEKAAVIFIKPQPVGETAAMEEIPETEEEAQAEEEREAFDRRALQTLADQLEEIHRVKGIPYREMLILAHSFKPFLEPLQEILEGRNIPYRSLVGSALWRAQHVRDLVSLAKCLGNPDDGLALLAVLRGPCCRLTDSEILYVSQLGNRSGIVTGLGALVKEANLEARCQLEAALQGNAGRAAAIFWVAERLSMHGKWREPVDRMPHHQLLRSILEEAGVWSAWHRTLLAEAHLTEEARQTKQERVFRELEAALQRVETIEQQRPLTLIRLARILEDHVDEIITETVETELAAGEDLVRIMTVHASKGLEAQVVAVLLPQAPKSSGKRDPMILLDRQYFKPNTPTQIVEKTNGLPLFSLTNLDRPEKDQKELGSLYKIACKAYQYLDKQEVARLFHVALTRSKLIILIAGVAEEGEKDRRHCTQKWVESVQDPFVTVLQPGKAQEPRKNTVASTIITALLPDEEAFYFRIPVPNLGRSFVAVTSLQKILHLEDKKEFQKALASLSDSLRDFVGGIPGELLRKQVGNGSAETGKIVGTLVHRALQMGSAFPRDPDKARQLYQAMVQPLVQPRVNAEDGEEETVSRTEMLDGDRIATTAMELLEKIQGGQMPRFKELLETPGHAEVDFTLPLPAEGTPSLIIRGRFDRLIGTNRLVDWKTDSGSAKVIAEKYREQMKIYALACYLHQDAYPETVTVHLAMTSTGEVVDLVYSAADLEAYKLWLGQMLMDS